MDKKSEIQYHLKDKISTNNVIALLYINEQNEYDNFITNLEEHVSSLRNYEFQKLINSLDNDEKMNRKTQKFYDKNKKLFDGIKSLDIKLGTFISNYLDSTQSNIVFEEPEVYKKINLYINSHKIEIDKMINLLWKIKELDIKYIILDEQNDFTNKEYRYMHGGKSQYYTAYNYLENMYVEPGYKKSCIYYKTTGSNYKISPFEIEVNNLVFSPSILPSEISEDNFEEKILKLNEEQQENYKKIQNSVELEVSIHDLRIECEKSLNIIQNLDNVDSKFDLIEVLKEIRENIGILETINNEYKEEVTYDNSVVTKTKLKNEVYDYYKWRDYNN